MIHLREFIVRQRHVKSSNIIFEVTEALGARNGDDILTLRKHRTSAGWAGEQPFLCARFFTWVASCRLRSNASPWKRGLVCRQSSSARSDGFCIAPVRKPRPSGCTPRSRCPVRDKRQAFRCAPHLETKANIALQRGNRMHRIRFSQSADARFRKAEGPHFARANQLRHRVDSVLNGNSRINPVLVIEIDGLNPQPAKTPSKPFARWKENCLRPFW